MPEHEVVREQVEKAREKQQKGIGLTTAVIAALMALANLLASSANTQKVVVETKIADWWAYSHSNDTNARIYMADERIAQLHGEKEAAEEFHKLYETKTGFRRGPPHGPETGKGLRLAGPQSALL